MTPSWMYSALLLAAVVRQPATHLIDSIRCPQSMKGLWCLHQVAVPRLKGCTQNKDLSLGSVAPWQAAAEVYAFPLAAATCCTVAP